MGEDQGRGLRQGVLLCEVQIALEQFLCPAPLRFVEMSLCKSQAEDFSPNHRPVNLVEVEQD